MKFKLEHYFLAAGTIIVVISLYLSYTSSLARAIRNGELINGLVLGTDYVDYSRHSDTLVFANYTPAKRFLNIISIPRDTHFCPQGYHFQRINEIYAYHYRMKKNDFLACQEVRRGVEQLFGNRVTIPYYIQFDYTSFRQIIDLLGGITIDVDEPMHYDDAAGNLHIHFEPGQHRLNGQRALEYVRYRGKAGDIGRVFRQQQFLKAALSRLKNPIVLLRLPEIVRVMSKEIKTNLTFWDLLSGVLEFKDLRAKDIRLAQLPGTPKTDYWEIDAENCAGLLDKIFPSSNTVTSSGPKIRVEVWNASGKNKLAEKINWVLRQQGYDVIEWGTFSVRQKKTLIKDLTGDLRSAQRIAEILNCGEVITRYDTKRFIDISVTLGEDCAIDEK